MWSLFDPKVVPHFTDLFGETFETAYVEGESKELFAKQVKARDMYARMMKTLAETGNGWMCFKDASNRKCNQTAMPGRTVHLSNLCTEIIEISSKDETAVCNLGSINLARHVSDGKFDFEKLAATTVAAVRQLDRSSTLTSTPSQPPMVEHAVAPGRPRHHGSTGRVFSHCDFRSTRRKRARYRGTSRKTFTSGR